MLIYIAHPVSAPDAAGVQANLERAKRWLRWCFRQTPEGYHFKAPWIATCEALDDLNPEDRARGMAASLEDVELSDAVWLTGGKISSGMNKEIDRARRRDIHIFDLTLLGPEPTRPLFQAGDHIGYDPGPYSMPFEPASRYTGKVLEFPSTRVGDSAGIVLVESDQSRDTRKGSGPVTHHVPLQRVCWVHPCPSQTS